MHLNHNCGNNREDACVTVERHTVDVIKSGLADILEARTVRADRWQFLCA